MQRAPDRSPRYLKRGDDEIDGNPLVAHLPLGPESDDDAFLALAKKPQFDPAERMLPRAHRRLLIKRLRRFFLPFLREHRRALEVVCASVIDGYLPRNPMTSAGQRMLNGCSYDATPPAIVLITGCSGMGKSTLATMIFSYMGGPVWRHMKFGRKPFPEAQLLFLRRNTPERCTVPRLCETFGAYTDAALGVNLYSGIFDKPMTRGGTNHIKEMRKLIANHHIGALVLDELQNLSLIGVGAESILAFLVNLRDEIGVPIVALGTPKALKLVGKSAPAARRFVEGGHIDLRRPTSADSPEWIELCTAVWEFQWVREPAEISPDICMALYEVSQGIVAIMLSAFAHAQLEAIENGSECVTAELIRKVFLTQMSPLHAAIRALQSGDPFLLDQFEGLYVNHWPDADQGEAEVEGDSHEQNSEDEAGAPDNAQDVGPRSSGPKKEREVGSPAPSTQSVLTPNQISEMVRAKSTLDLLQVLGHS